MFPNLLNARDLGGHATANGRQTRLNAFVRSDLPNCLTPDGTQALLDYGIRTVIDLRWRNRWTKSPIFSIHCLASRMQARTNGKLPLGYQTNICIRICWMFFRLKLPKFCGQWQMPVMVVSFFTVEWAKIVQA